MKCRFLLTVGVILWSTWSGFAIEKTTVNLDNSKPKVKPITSKITIG